MADFDLTLTANNVYQIDVADLPAGINQNDSFIIAALTRNAYTLDSLAGAATPALNDLSDVTITTPAANEILMYNGTAWVNLPNASTADIYVNAGAWNAANQQLTLTDTNATTGDVVVSLVHAIDNHSDVDTSTTAPNTNEVLTWDGTNWVPAVSANIYTTDGTLTGARTVTMGANNLSFASVNGTDQMSSTWASTGWNLLQIDSSGANTITSAIGLGSAGVAMLQVSSAAAAEQIGFRVADAVTDTGVAGWSTDQPQPQIDTQSVVKNTATDGQFLRHVGTEGEVEFLDAVINDMADVDTVTTAPAAGDRLQFDGTNWVTFQASIAQAVLPTGQDISSAAAAGTDITFTGSTVTTFAGTAPTVAAGGLTAPFTGIYRVTCQIRYTSPNNVRYSPLLRLVVNGTRSDDVIGAMGYLRDASGDQDGSVIVTGLVSLTAGQVVGANIVRESGNNNATTIQAGSQFAIERVV